VGSSVFSSTSIVPDFFAEKQACRPGLSLKFLIASVSSQIVSIDADVPDVDASPLLLSIVATLIATSSDADAANKIPGKLLDGARLFFLFPTLRRRRRRCSSFSRATEPPPATRQQHVVVVIVVSFLTSPRRRSPGSKVVGGSFPSRYDASADFRYRSSLFFPFALCASLCGYGF